jgi:hypothetical protein
MTDGWRQLQNEEVVVFSAHLILLGISNEGG